MKNWNNWKIATFFLSAVLVIVIGVGAFILSKSDKQIAVLSGNVTSITDRYNQVVSALLNPKVFKDEASLVTWLDTNQVQGTTDKELSYGYVAKGLSTGYFMELWSGWSNGKTLFMDMSKDWKITKETAIGINYGILTIVDSKVYLINPIDKRFIVVEKATTPSATGSWGQ